MSYNIGTFTNNGTFSNGQLGQFFNGASFYSTEIFKDAEFINNNGTINAFGVQNSSIFTHNGVGVFEVMGESGLFTNHNSGEVRFNGDFTITKKTNFANTGTMYIAGGATLTVPSTPFIITPTGAEDWFGISSNGTITFGFKDGKSALIKGSFWMGGKLIIETDGMDFSQQYQIIDGEVVYGEIILNAHKATIEFTGVNAKYAKYGFDLNGDGLWVWLDKNNQSGSTGGNQNNNRWLTKAKWEIIRNAMLDCLNSNPQAMRTLLPQLNQAIIDTDKTLQKSVITQPKNMLNAFKADTLTSPLNSAYVGRLTASSEMIMNDSSNFINPLERVSQTQFFATPFGGVLKGNELSGHLFGLSLGLTHIDDEYIAQGHFAYAKGQSTQDLTTQSTELNGDLFQVGGFARLFYGKVETDINANFIFGKFSLDNVWLNADMMNSNSNFNNYQVNLGGVVGWRFGENLSVKPFVGVQGYYENQGEFQQDSGLKLTSKAYNSMVLDALAGLEGRYIFDNGSFIFAKASYESKLYNSHKEVFMQMANNESLSYENETYERIISANLGARLLSTQHFKLDIEALYKHYDSGLNYFGGNLGVKWSF